MLQKADDRLKTQPLLFRQNHPKLYLQHSRESLTRIYNFWAAIV